MARRKKSTTDETNGTESGEKMLDESGSLDDLHPFVMGLLQELPIPGSYWPPERRQLWLATATSIFQMIYTEAAPPALPPEA